MSLLTHSMLAATLLLTVTADPCSRKTVGVQTSLPLSMQQVVIAFPGAKVSMPLDQCSVYYPGSNGPYGETITACNKDSNGVAPTISTPGGLTPVYISCVDGCAQNVTVDSIIFC